VKSKLKFALVLFRNILITLVLLEIGLGLFYSYYDESGVDGNTERIIASGMHRDTGMSDEDIKIMHRELREQDMLWEPYLHYRFKPQNGKFNTIYENGRRKTANPSLKDSATAIKIFCFGGSTMYGSGARDEHTIPSELSQIIHKNFPEQNVEVTNFGCHGYTRASENIQLQRELVKNNIPDIVIFYDGVNEVISAHQNNKAGSPTNAYNRVKEFKVAHSYKKRIKLFIYASNLYRFVTTMQRKIFSGQTYAKLNARPDGLAPEIASNYIGFVQLSKSLENEYGCKVYNFMQPHIYSKNTLSDAEQLYYKDQQYYENLYTLSYNAVRKDSLMIHDDTFVDISDAFDNIEKTVYFDFCHTGEYGNQLVAAQMFANIKSELSPKKDSIVTNTATKQLTEINQQ
jgi:lysophospholipase L1-like esterase